MSVKIEIFGETAVDALRELRDLTEIVRDVKDGAQRVAVISAGGENGPEHGKSDSATGDVEVPSGGSTQIVRERGKPAPGRARRTKEEIAEDEAAEAAGSQISTNPENRVGPEDAPEVQDQDKADEQAEVEATREPTKPLTIEDVKAVVGEFVEKSDMARAQADGPALFVEVLGAPPAGDPYWKLSTLPSDQEKLAAVIAVWKKAIANLPKKGG